MRSDYNPFSKDFNQIAAADLLALRGVAEGWYVEYKREISSASAMAKSVSAFANTHGGWVFYGISEKSKDEPVAGEFIGIPRDEADAALQRLRQGVASSVQPDPFFEVKTIFGPEPNLGLAQDRCIVVVRVPWGASAPYIHKDGRIYRRVGDGSEPRHETDRYMLDQLAARSKAIEEEHADWIAAEVETSEAEKDAAYLRVFLIADFWGDYPSKDVSLSTVRKIMQEGGGDFDVPLSNVHRSMDGFVCRQTHADNPEGLSLTWRLHGDFRSEILIPLRKFRLGNLTNLRASLDGYANGERFVRLCAAQHYTDPTVIDLNILLVVLIGLARKQAALAREFGGEGPVLAKVRLAGLWRTIPFFDVAHVLDEYEANGLPLCLSDESTVFRGRHHGSFMELPGPDAKDPAQFPNLMMAVHLFAMIANALGASISKDGSDQTTAFSKAIAEFVAAGHQAIEVQKRRRPD